MNSISKLFQPINIAKLAIFLCCSLLVSCGGSITTAGIGGTGITSGEITGFGSVHMNGVIFDTTNSEFEVDDEMFNSQEDAVVIGGLSEGMVAKVYGTTNVDGTTGTATMVVYDDDIEGPVSNLIDSGDQQSFNIFNILVHIDRNNTVFRDDEFDLLSEGDLVEISGLYASDTEIEATFVDRDGQVEPGFSVVELEGKIESHDDISKTFTIGSVTIDYSTTLPEDIQLLDGVKVGLIVEVEGIYEVVNSISAIEIQEDDDDFDSDVESISLEGIIANFSDTATLLFTINGQFVDASGAVFFDTNEVEFTPTTNELYDGVRVEVEGTIVGGMLFADEVELH